MRLPQPTGIAAAVVWLPPQRHTAADAIAAGVLDEPMAARIGYRELTVSALAPPEMAVLAARKAVADAGCRAEDIGFLAHASLYHQGHDFWSAPHYIANEIGASTAIPVGVQQTSNGAAAAIDIALARMVIDPDAALSLVTTADRFAPPGFDRWSSDFDVAYGDAATALLLTTGDAPYQLLASATVAGSRFERVYRGDDPFSSAPRSGAVDVRRTKLAFRGSGELPLLAATVRSSVHRVVRHVLADMDMTVTDPRVRYLTLPRIGTGALAELYEGPVAELELASTEVLDLGRETGHLGAGDSIANLADIDAAGMLAPGEIVLLLSVGNGFTWSCLAVRRQ
ncbi:ketoacyl-ACP synthase III family protein [Kibdelosporangium aridum]|uniref:3-oxoacyl-[acyl-carrier-protein] synthase-3 n=1 Tax=Kibdelosporangium aridum TaxID=2030 RepID=A0A1Y5WSE2_KIBAR|nr:ketoacyl-ACP synthase III family protein [Kibdelosporangium aridum]SMC48535.1 3-oxoacyl-[acyl-carrier-protein] synthase-3 [Kibdelosporangium aridum]